MHTVGVVHRGTFRCCVSTVHLEERWAGKRRLWPRPSKGGGGNGVEDLLATVSFRTPGLHLVHVTWLSCAATNRVRRRHHVASPPLCLVLWHPIDKADQCDDDDDDTLPSHAQSSVTSPKKCLAVPERMVPFSAFATGSGQMWPGPRGSRQV